MLVHESVELPIPASLALDALTAIHVGELARLATAATSSGEALLERSGLVRLDDASQCHFGVQLGRPIIHDSLMTLQLRWWNDRARSLTPGFIGELQIRKAGGETSALTISGEYHPRAYLYELADRSFLNRMSRGVAANFVAGLRAKVVETAHISAA